MKKLLIGILTIFITLALIILGLSMTLKGTIVSTVDIIIKNEVADHIVDFVDDNTSYNKEEIRASITKFMNENAEIKKAINKCFEQMLNIINNKETEPINIKNELENLIDSSSDYLKDYGITITEKEKEELLKIVTDEEANDIFNKEINELKNSMTSEEVKALEIFTFLTSNTFKLILIVTIIVLLGLIALMKKSYYKWLNNLGASSIICGLLFSAFIPLLTDFVSKSLEESEVVISASSFMNYGIASLTIGVLAIILSITFSKLTKRKEMIEV